MTGCQGEEDDMPEYNYPGVFRQEIRQQRRVPQEVSTANFGLLGFTSKGPVGVPVITRDPTEWFRIFGEYTSKSVTPLIAAAYFANEGQNLVQVREVGAGALPSSSHFTRGEQNEQVSATSDSGTVSLDGTLNTAYDIDPGSVRVVTWDNLSQASVVIGEVLNGDTGPYTFKMPTTYVVPGTVQITGAPEDITDDGSGALDDGGSITGTIDYLTGTVTLDGVAVASDTDLEATYKYVDVDVILNEIVGRALAGATLYHGKLNRAFPHLPSITFKWTSSGSATTATVNSGGQIIDESSEVIGVLDQVSGEFHLDVTGSALDAGSIMYVDYGAIDFLEATDDGDGVISGDLFDVDGTIDYETGEYTGTVTQTELDSTPIYVLYHEVIHAVEARNAGVFGDNLRLRITRNASSIDPVTGVYSLFSVEVLEVDGTVTAVLDPFSRVRLDDITSPDHIGQVINDRFTGSSSVRIVSPLTGAIPDSLNGTRKTNVLVRSPDGVNNPALVTALPVHGAEIVPGTIELTYRGTNGVTYTLKDDSQGSFLQDADTGEGLSISTVATVDYATGVISVVASEVPSSALKVYASYTLTSEVASITAQFMGGSDGAPLTRAEVTDLTLEQDDRGIYAFNGFDDLLHLGMPDFAGDPDAQRAIASYLNNRRDSMAIFAPPEGLSPSAAARYKQFVLQLNGQLGERAAMYWPWIDVEDPLTRRTVGIPPHGHVAAVISKTDRNRNVGKAPAGVNDGGITYLRGLQYNLTQREFPEIFEAGINAIWAPPRQGNMVFGARTLDTTGGEFTYINKRRVVDFVSLSIFRSLWWAVFENSGPELFAQIFRQVDGMLGTFYDRRILAGDSKKESYFVQCDRSNNPEEVTARGFVYVDYGIKTPDTTEFIVLRHRQIVG
jgi:phage tail sheath protein FI